MNYRQFCVIDAKNFYKTVVLAFQIKTETGQKLQVQFHELQAGEQLLDADPPFKKRCAGDIGFISPRWDADESAWVEAATEEEIAAWEAEHPAPKKPEPVPTVEELQAKIAALTTSNQMLEDCIIEMAGVIYA